MTGAALEGDAEAVLFKIVACSARSASTAEPSGFLNTEAGGGKSRRRRRPATDCGLLTVAGVRSTCDGVSGGRGGG
jgi:hypothetical protein